ncbi:hypothetical protein Ciccas_011798 [Cichlidogyrus casuarinus]|uniref:Choline transporter-like protein n=1 Tax=Cichlidogyrus casuarinus TaxID=1844966 RepID=A0ABD2PQX3_9PLAT
MFDETPVKASDDHLYEENKAREHEPNFDGIAKSRSCTDIICFIFFVIFLLGQICLAGFAFHTGNPQLLMRPTNSRGVVCPPSKPHLFLFDVVSCARLGPMVVFTGCPTPEICVAHCPTTTFSWNSLYQEEIAAGKFDTRKRQSQLICRSDFDPVTSSLTLKEIVKNEFCAPYYLPSTSLLGRCVPILAATSTETELIPTVDGSLLIDAFGRNITTFDIINGNFAMNKFFQVSHWAQNAMADVSVSWPWILLALVMAGILSFIWCLLMRYFSGVMVYMTLITFVLVFTAATLYCFARYAFVAQNWANGHFIITSDINVYLNLKDFWLGLGISGLIFTVLIVIILIFLRKRISLAVAIMGQASKAVGQVPSTLLAPVTPLFFQVLCLGVWIAVTIYLASITRSEYQLVPDGANGNPVYNFSSSSVFLGDPPLRTCNPGDARCFFVRYSQRGYVYVLHLYNVLLSLWFLCFVDACHTLVLAGVFANWYWTKGPNEASQSSAVPLLNSVGRLMRYHLGTAAFGSLILALVKFVRWLLMAVARKVDGATNGCGKFVLCCCTCCLWCLETVLRFLTKNAYIMTAMSGKAFCSAARDSFFLITRNCLRLLVVDSLTDFILFIGKLVVTVLVGVGSYYLFSTESIQQWILINGASLNYYYVPVVLTVLGTYFVCCLFFSVFNLAVDTLFICIMEDLERNDGSEEKPYFMSKELKKILKIKNAPPADKDEQVPAYEDVQK